MKLHLQQVRPIVIKWLEAVVIPQASSIQVFLITFVMSSSKQQQQFNDFINRYVSMFADENGYLDLEEVEKNSTKALEKAGGKIKLPYLDWILDQEDLNKIFNIAKEFAK